MNDRQPASEARRAIQRDAAAWVVREERGFTPGEQDELSQWLAADPRNGEALRECRWAWREFDRIAGMPATVAPAPDPDLLAPRSAPRRPRRRFPSWVALGGLAAAAFVLWISLPLRPSWLNPDAARPLSTALAAPCERYTLEDGSVIELNRGARVSTEFTRGLRRVRLERGEAHFTVAKDPARPFVVEAGGVTVRAVGTAFNVRLAAAAVEVVVAEGRVAVGREIVTSDPAPIPVLDARQCVVVPLHKIESVPPVATLSEAELAARLAWQPRRLDFSDAPLAEVVGEFNLRNPVRITLGAASLRDLRVNASIQSDNVEGFVRLLESSLELRAEWRSEAEIVLLPARRD